MSLLEQVELEAAKGECTLSQFCAKVASLFQVRTHEVAVLELRHSMLRFMHPPELRKTGLIPMISSAQAAKTATSRRAEIFNNFTSVRHSGIFETIKLGSEGPQTIQKLMSAPILGVSGDVLGVVQVSRKGNTPMEAGADFETSDLQTLREVASSLARVAEQLLECGGEVASAPANAAPAAAL